MRATRQAIAALPYPEEILVDKQEIRSAAVAEVAKAIRESSSVAEAADSFRRAVEEEIQRRAQTVVEKYPLWWNQSEKNLSRATSRLHTALMRSALETGRPRLTSGG